MADKTIYLGTGPKGERNQILVYWYDENGYAIETRLDVNVENQDKPRVLVIEVDGMEIARLEGVKHKAKLVAG